MKFEVFGTAFIAVALAACSSQPTQPAASAPAPAPSTPATSAVSVAPGANGQAPVISRTLLSAGYKPTTIKGEVYYCRMEDVTNTAFKKKVCLTEAQLKDEERRVKELQDRMLQRGANPSCAGPSCG